MYEHDSRPPKGKGYFKIDIEGDGGARKTALHIFLDDDGAVKGEVFGIKLGPLSGCCHTSKTPTNPDDGDHLLLPGLAHALGNDKLVGPAVFSKKEEPAGFYFPERKQQAAVPLAVGDWDSCDDGKR